MKQKLITITLTLIAVLAPLLIIPSENNYNILKLILLLVTGLGLLVLILANYKKLTLDKKDIIILIFLGLAFLSTFLSSNIRKSIIGAKNRYEGLLMFITYICIYLSSKKYFKYEKISIFLNIMCCVSIIIGILGIAQKYISYMPLYPIFNKGICSTFGNSNFFGSFISIVLPIASATFILKGNKKSFILSLIIFFNMISSGTRSTWVAFVVVGILGLIYLIKQKNKKYFIRTVFLLIFFIGICIYLFNGFGFTSKTVVNSSINSTNEPIIKVQQIKEDLKKIKEKGLTKEVGSQRIQIWEMTMKLIIKKPICGCGPDNLTEGLVINCPNEIYEFAKKNLIGVDKAHNEYLHIASTIGIPAFVCYIIFIVLILFPKIKLTANNKIYFIICLAIISYLTQAFFNISTIGVAPLFWMILGLSDNEDFINKLNKIL